LSAISRGRGCLAVAEHLHRDRSGLAYAADDENDVGRTGRVIICGSGFVLAYYQINWQHHPFEVNPQYMAATLKIAYPIHDPPFPSNTSAVTFAAAASVWLWNRKMGLLLLIPATLMPIAKMYAGLYYPSDILAGAALGIATAFFISKVAMPWFEPIVSRLLKALRKLSIA
jgi:membrane-associated phospholipid phosphatase